MKPEIKSYPNLSDLSRAVAELIAELAEVAIEEGEVFSLVLSGGRTPHLLYEMLGQNPFTEKIDWKHMHLFWGDERCVPPDHADSNFALAFDTIISAVSIPDENVHRIPAEIEPPETAAREYEHTLREFFRSTEERAAGPKFPSFDLVLLGMGEDGHTASLFPDNVALEENNSWVVAVDDAKASPPVPRITLTFPIINRAKCVVLLASGSSKLAVLREILRHRESAPYPVARVQPSGRLLWFIVEGSV